MRPASLRTCFQGYAAGRADQGQACILGPERDWEMVMNSGVAQQSLAAHAYEQCTIMWWPSL